MKKINKTLQEKYNDITNNENKKMAKFLKRRRLELGLTLEHVSDGICSTSYLSKIENCQVEVDDSYFTLLFEKLDLKYENVVESRKVPIYSKIIKAYLENDKDYIKEITSKLVVDKTYCDTEVELLLLFYNLIWENYKECKEGLEKLINIRNTLLEEELQILMYIEAVYHFKLNELEVTEECLIELYESDIKDEILKIAINDLTLDFCFFTNEICGFFWILRLNNNNKYLKLLKRIEVKHELQELVLKPVMDIEKDFIILKEAIKDKYSDLYDYYYVLALIKRNEYLKAYEYAKELEYDQEFLMLKAILINAIDDINISFEFLLKLRETNLIDNCWSYTYLEYIRIKLEKYSYMQLYSTLKTNIFYKDKKYQNYYLNTEFEKELFIISYELGKYKEVVKLFRNRTIIK